jgi:hypothetical protein
MTALDTVEQFIEANPHLYRKLCFWSGKRNAESPIAQVREYLMQLVIAPDPHADTALLVEKWSEVLSLPERNGIVSLSPIAIGDYSQSGNWYRLAQGEYSVLNEPVLHEICYQGQQQAVITLNRYGCLVLNAEHLLIVDVDLGVPQFANPRDCPVSCQVALSQRQAIGALRLIVEQYPHLGFRVYHTRNGLRYFCTTQEFDPLERQTQRLMQNLYADPLYAKLCKFQATFRARLQPKPWRIEAEADPERFVYDPITGIVLPVASAYAVCHLIEIIGEPQILPQFEQTIQVHDAYCRVSHLGLQLA